MAKTPSARRRNETDPTKLYQAMLRRLPRRIYGQGQIVLAPSPALLEQNVTSLKTVFAQYGRVFNKEETQQLRDILIEQLQVAWDTSPYARVVVNWETEQPPSTGISYFIGVEPRTAEDEYNLWVDTRTPPLFGAHGDAKVAQLAALLGEPKDVPVLDVGAGTGRNTLPLARAGHPTDAIELTQSLADILRKDAAEAGLEIRVFQTDATEQTLEIPGDYYKLVVIAEVVSTHIRDIPQCNALFTSACEALEVGGLLVFNAFLPNDNYRPDRVARELSQVYWCNLFTREEIAEAMSGLPFERLSDESVYEFEKQHLPRDAWPPTGWFEGWTKGVDLFDLPTGEAPMELRWLVYRKTAEAVDGGES